MKQELPENPVNEADDRLMDALLHEHARLGNHDDEALLARLEKTIANPEAASSMAPAPVPVAAAPQSRHRSSRRAAPRWAWPLGLAASVALAAVVTWRAILPAGSPSLAESLGLTGAPDPYEGMETVPLKTELPAELAVGTPKDLSKLVMQHDSSREAYKDLAEVSPFTESPSASPMGEPKPGANPAPPVNLAANSPAHSEGESDALLRRDSPAAPASPPSATVADASAPADGRLTGMVSGGNYDKSIGAGGGGAPLGGERAKARAEGFGRAIAPSRPMILPQEEHGGFHHHPPHHPLPSPPPVSRERYGQLVDNPWRSPADEVFSTFSIDVDTASYANFRRMTQSGARIPADSVRLEEMVNYFDYAYPQPADGHPFGIAVDSAVTPWNPDTRLVRVALQGREIARPERAPANLVFLLDVSGSMNEENKLPLVAKSFQLLLEEMNASDTISIVVYAGAEGLALPPTKCDTAGREKIDTALKKLHSGGSTNGGAGIQLAYKLARENFKESGINRVILATDGDFNVGVTEDGGLVSLVEKEAKSKVFLTVLGFGTGNLNDGMLEAITNKGNGVYHYIDSLNEGRRVFLQKMMGTLVTIAKDVKIQVEFNPAMVSEYRLLGYANRMLNKEDFNNDRVDAGDIGAGHTVTAFYEIKTGPARAKVDAPRYTNPLAGVPAPAPAPAAVAEPPANAKEWLTVKLRYKEPEGDTSKLIERPFAGEDKAFTETSEDFRFATAVAMTASLLRETNDFGQSNLRQAREIATAAKGSDPHGLRAEFVTLLDRLLSKEDDRPRR